MELIAYQLPGAPPMKLEPADFNRDWMDASPGKATYRCLPLAIANQAGWVVRCPLDFKVQWNGRDEAHTNLAFFSNDPERHFWSTYITDHFGQGILTFHIPWLFRTPPGYALIVRGPTNTWVAGAHPLDGVVETEWATATFTMNWKIVDSERLVHFKKDQPICQLLPYPIALLESVEPRIATLKDNAEEYAAYEKWRNSRAAFMPARGDNEYQKDYFVGRQVEGERFSRHKTRFDLKKFELEEAAK